jgi:hypothetical protein
MQDTTCTEVRSSIFKKYLVSKGIRILDGFEDGEIDLYSVSQHEIDNQLNALKEFHDRASGYVGYSRERIKTATGKDIEKYKVDLRRAQKDYKQMDKECDEYSFEEFLLKYMDENIKRAEKCIKLIYENGYVDLIIRSMKKKEVCIGDSSFSNIRVTDTVEVVSLEDCSFNMIENDAVYFLRKLKRKGVEIDYHGAAEEFCRLEKLQDKSKVYILALLSYPYEFMKYYGRLRENKKGLNSFEWRHKFKKAIMMDGESLI